MDATKSSSEKRKTSSCYIYRTLRPNHDPDTPTPTKGINPAHSLEDAPPLHWGRKRHDFIFSCSLSDFFIMDADAWRPRMWEVIKRTPQFTYLILTKRVQRILTHPDKCLPPDWGEGYQNVALGVTVEAEKYLWRIDMLNKISCRYRWLSAEPLLTPLPTLHKYLGSSEITLVHCGGESDKWHPRRPKAPPGGTWLDAFRGIRDQCAQARIPFFFLQTGGSKPCRCGQCSCKWGERRLDGQWHQQFPVPTIIANGPRRGKRQRERLLRVLAQANIETYKTKIQTETRRGNHRQVDRVLLTQAMSNQTLNQLEDTLPDTRFNLETWPLMWNQP